MTCYHPINAWQYPNPKPNGKTHITFRVPTFIYNNIAQSIILPCGKCIGCRLSHSREWAIRITHEASLYQANSFITLTYNEASLPTDKSLHPRDFTLFLKKLRLSLPHQIRFYHCGEYGDKLSRPHYYAIIFNHDFPEKKLFRDGKNPLYMSQSLSEIWNKGHVYIGKATFKSAAYVARYVTKKINGEPAEAHYQGRQPEYATMSRMPGLGYQWFHKYKNDLYPDDFVLMDGRKFPIPRYYDKLYALTNPDEMAEIKASRVEAGGGHPEDETPDRLLTREIVQQLKADRLKRKYESDDT